MKKKIIVILVLISVVIISLFVKNKINRKQEENESTKIEPIMIGNMVASYEYVDREINIDYFYDLDGNTTYEKLENDIGKPNGVMGSGITTPYYQVGNQYVVIWFERDDDGNYRNILRMALYTNDAYVEDIPLK
jgi:hypothetical protein